MPPSEVLRGVIKAGEGNQLVAFQKLVCAAVALGSHITTPVLFHCDRSWSPGDCDENRTVPMTDVLQLSARTHALVSDRPPTRVLTAPYYMKDECGKSGAFAFSDLVGFSDRVRAYGERLLGSCPSPCMVIQHRAGRDWEWHKRLGTGGSIEASVVADAARRWPRHSCVLMAPERIDGAATRCARFKHSRSETPMVRFLGELHAAAHAKVFVYNGHSTVHWIVRRFAQSSLVLDPLRPPRQARGHATWH